MKILFFTSEFEDYLQDQLLIGLRKLYGYNLVDYPKKDVMYETCCKDRKELYGCGFTIWKNLEDINIDRNDIFEKLYNGEFDILIFSSIWRQKSFFKNLRFNEIKRNSNIKVCFLDGEDHSKIYLPALFYGKYFKREIRNIFSIPFVEKINFSIPDEKLRNEPIEKIKLFAKHVQCKEAYKIRFIRDNCEMKYVFDNEESYYHDIAISKYAVTMQKGGWDCMRHYEIAANQTVPCFYKLNRKPAHCAPHGLIDMENVIIFNNAEELENKINYIENNGLYKKLQKKVFEWAKTNSCSNISKYLLKKLGKI